MSRVCRRVKKGLWAHTPPWQARSSHRRPAAAAPAEAAGAGAAEEDEDEYEDSEL